MNAIPVPPAELLLDADKGLLAVAVGDQAVGVATVGAVDWPMESDLALLLEPEQQPVVLAEVGPDDR